VIALRLPLGVATQEPGLDLRLDDEHARVHGKGGSVRTVLLDDRGYVALLKLYLGQRPDTCNRAIE
jgi:hypothetical protein